MKVWVVYRDYGSREGYGEPEAVFDSYEKAEVYMREHESFYSIYKSIELEVE